MPKLVPDRWLQYTPHGEVIKGTRIVALKVPLNEGRSRSLQASERFTPKMMMEALPAVKYIVDLTFTHGYYDRKEFLAAGVRHVKILVPGKILPPPKTVNKFFKALDDFLATAKSDELVGVHCTHGVNRTGYFICRYLIQQLGWDIQDAIKAFETARGHPMERENYVNHLHRTPKGQRIDTSNVSLAPENVNSAGSSARGGMQPTSGTRRSTKKRPASHPIPGPPSGFHSLRRGFANGRLFPPHPPPPEHLGFRPRFGRPPPILPPPPPPPTRTPFGPRSMRYGRPPAPGFPNPAFPPRMPRPLMVPVGGPRLPLGPRLPPPPPPPGPGARPPPGLGPRLPPGPGLRPPPGPGPRLPSMMLMPGPGPRSPRLGLPPSPVTQTMMAKGIVASSPNQKHNHPSRPHLSKDGSTMRNVQVSRQTPPDLNAAPLFNENFQQDFTVDTFEENLTTTELSAPSLPGAMVASAKRRYRGRGGNRSSRGK